MLLTEINMEQTAIGAEHEVVQMPAFVHARRCSKSWYCKRLQQSFLDQFVNVQKFTAFVWYTLQTGMFFWF